MPSDNRLKSFGWILDILQHGVFYISVSDNVCISLILLLSLDTPLLMLEARFVEVYILAHNNRLDRDKHL